MKKFLFVFLVSIFLFSCKNSSNEESDSTNSDDTEQVTSNDNDDNSDPEEIEIEPFSSLDDFYIISVSATESQQEAIDEVIELEEDYLSAGYLWIPDYASLSGKEMYVVFLGPFDYLDKEAFDELINYQDVNSGAYLVKASQEEERITLLSKFDYRVNGVKQKLVIAYAEETALDDYYEEGGEDWGWFNYDVDMYFSENNSTEITFIYGLPDWITTTEMKKIAAELDNKDLYFGYYLIDGNNKIFIQHDISDYVIEQACDFFGYE